MIQKKFIKFFLLCFFYSCFIFSQPGMWTWINGTNTANSAGNFGTMGMPSPANQPPALYHAAYWTDLQGRFWVFGGGNVANQQYCAMWMYDPAANIWTWMNGPTGTQVNGVYGIQGTANAANHPGSRAWGATAWTDNAGDLWLFGGFAFDAVGTQMPINDLWKYNIASNTWTWVKGANTCNQAGVYGMQGTANVANTPGARYETSASWTDNNGDLWLFGGEDITGKFNDLWKYNIVSNSWTWMKGTNTYASPGNYGVQGVAAVTNEPPARLCFGRWKDLKGNLWMMGGRDYNNAYLNDLWRYDIVSNQWTWMKGANTPGSVGSYGTQCVAAASNEPPCRDENRACWVDTCSNFWMFGGFNGSTAYNDLWHYNIRTNEWTWASGNAAPNYGVLNISAATNMPLERYGPACFSPNVNEICFFGGRTAVPNAMRDDIWKFVVDTNCVGICHNPVANFFGLNLSGCAPLTVNFTNTSLYSTSWLWNFGDGNTSTQQNPSHTYPNPGNYTVTLIATDGFSSDTMIITTYVTVYANAVANFTSSNDTICTGSSIIFTNSSTNSNASNWNFGNGNTSTSTSPIETYNNVGTYTVTLIAQNMNGCNDTTFQNILVVPAYTANVNASICAGQNYTLPDGGTTSIAGTYKDTLSAINGCDSIITTVLSVVSVFNMNVSASICSGDSYTLPDGSSTTVGGTYKDTLTASGGCDSVITTVLSIIQPSTFAQNILLCQGASYTLPGGGPVVSAAGIYYDTLTSSKGCDSIITTNLSFKPNSSSTINATICSGNNYVLPNGIIVTASGSYIDTIQSINGCDSVITVNLLVNSKPIATAGISVTIVPGDSTVLTATGGGAYNWYPSAGLSSVTDSIVIAKPTSTSLYCVIVTSAAGCKDTACVIVKVEVQCPQNENLKVPNAFSPNADNVNDEFCLQGWENCLEEFEVIIFNRWGEKVYESIKPDFCWDGTYNNTVMDAQVFVYYVKAKFTNITEPVVKKGNITLIR